MAGMEFEYDEQGGTFYYFLLSFLALLLFPATYYLWPKKKVVDEAETKKQDCLCSPCQIKRQHLKSDDPWTTAKNSSIKIGLLIGWVFFIWVAYKASQVELDLEEFDPFAELGIDRGATDREVKKAYRKLSLIYHPDRETGDPKRFMRITKAHAALTDEEAKKNWEEYGNPDGPGAMQFGIALPKWIVEKRNSVWVLAAYGLVFMIILPVAVGSWWYRSIKFSAEQILMDTMQLYRCFVHKTPNMILKRTVMILAASLEFEKSHNNEICNRPSDNEEIPMLMKELPHLQEKNKEPPLCYPYSVKARALLHAHFSRLDLPLKTLDIDRSYVVKKAPYLLNEMINIGAMLVAYGHAGRTSKIPRLNTMENMMRVSQMLVQGVWDTKSSLLQLPHITEDMLRHFLTKKRSIRTVKDFVQMKDEERRGMLRNLGHGEYEDIMTVCANMPHVIMEQAVSVLDDEDSNVITAGSIVTVNVRLQRRPLSDLFDKESAPQCITYEAEELRPQLSDSDEEELEQEAAEEKEDAESLVKKPATKAWQKNNKKKGAKGGKKKKQLFKTTTIVKKSVSSTSVVSVGSEETKEGPTGSNASTPKSVSKSKSRSKRGVARDGSGDGASSCEETGSEDDSDVEDSTTNENDGGEKSSASPPENDDEDDWMKYQSEAKKELLDTKSKETHEVHAPYFPLVKQEWWWLYIGDKKNHSLITAPVQLCSLKREEEVPLKFSAPHKPGKYRYSVILRSDSYFLDFDQFQHFDIDVKEAKKVETHPQWDEVTDEEDKDNDATDSDDESTDEDSD